MGISHGHLKRLVPQPHLHPPDVYATPDQPRSASVTQRVRNQIRVLGKPDLGLGFMPDRAIFVLFNLDEGSPLGSAT